MADDRKFEYRDGLFYNRVSGEPIPAEEPVIIFRARDWHALEVLTFYQGLATDAHHIAAVQDRINEFRAFKDEFPERMKEPGVTRHIRLNSAEKTPPASSNEAALVEALERFTRHWEPWMDDTDGSDDGSYYHADSAEMSIFARMTFGELRHARALIARHRDGRGGE